MFSFFSGFTSKKKDIEPPSSQNLSTEFQKTTKNEQDQRIEEITHVYFDDVDNDLDGEEPIIFYDVEDSLIFEKTPLKIKTATNIGQVREGEEKKTDDVSKGYFSWIGHLFSGPVEKMLDTGINFILGKKILKEPIINASKENILNNTNDPVFSSFIDTINKFMGPVVDKTLTNSQSTLYAVLNNYAQPIKDIIELNLYQGFSQLTTNVAKNKDQIENYDNQNSCLNVFSYLLQIASPHINQNILSDITEAHKEKRQELEKLCMKLFPDREVRKEKEKLIRAYVKNPKNLILQQILDGQKISANERNILTTCLQDAIEQHKQVHQAFEKVTDAILACLFPDESKSLVFPGGLKFIQQKVPWFPNYLYNNYFKASLTKMLMDFYAPVENCANKQVLNKEMLSNSLLNDEDIATIGKIPSAFLINWSKNAIHTNPSIVKTLTEFLNKSTGNFQKETNENTKKTQLLTELSQGQLANWFIKAAQDALNTKDTNLLALADFFKDFINDLSLTLLAEGRVAFFPNQEKVSQDQFLKDLIEKITNKLTKEKGFEINEIYLNKFLDDLLIPLEVKKIIIPELLKVINQLKSDIILMNLDNDAEAIIKSYKYGKNILSLIDKVTDEVIEEILEKNFDFFDSKTVNGNLEEILDIYFPGLEVTQGFKDWIKTSISAFSSEDVGNSPQSVQLLKIGFRVILKKSIATTVQKNFENDSDYAAQLLKNFDKAFSIAFSQKDSNFKETILKGQKIQANIHQLKNKISEIKNAPLEPFKDLTPKQNQLLTNLKLVQVRYLRKLSSDSKLKLESDYLLEKLDVEWSDPNYRALARNVLALYPIDPSALRIPAKQVQFDEMCKKIKRDSPEHYKVIQSLVILNSTSLESLTKIFNIDSILEDHHSLTLLENDFFKAKQSVEDFVATSNVQAWFKAKEQIEEILYQQDLIIRHECKIIEYENQFESCLPVFKILSAELTKLVGLESKEEMNLPSLLRDKVWPYIQQAKEETISRLLFTHLTPLLLVVSEIEENRQKLKTISNDEFAVKAAKTVSEQILSELSHYVTSFKPVSKEILKLFDESIAPSNEQVELFQSHLQEKMISLGAENLEASFFSSNLEDYLQDTNLLSISTPEKKLEFIHALKKIAETSEFKGFNKQQIVTIAFEIFNTTNTKGKNKFAKHSQKLAKNLNNTLLAQGKKYLNNSSILETYERFKTQKLNQQQINEKTELLEDLEMTQKIKKVIITPEQIADYVSDFIPGASDLHTLVAPELQTLLAGEDETFVEHRQLIGQYIEGMMLKVFIKIAEANHVEGQDIIQVITEKLKDLIPQAKREGTNEEVARTIIEQLISEIGGLKNQTDFQGVPLPLQNLVYTKFHEVFNQYLTPVIIPILEIENSRQHLNEISGSERFNELGTAIISLVFNNIPRVINNYQAIAEKIQITLSAERTVDEKTTYLLANKIEELVNFNKLSHELPKLVSSPKLVEKLNKLIVNSFLDEKLQKKIQKLIPDRLLAKEVFDLAVQTPNKKISETLLVQAYLETVENKVSQEEFKAMEKALEQGLFIKQINQILLTPKEMFGLLKTMALPNADKELESLFIQTIQNFLHDKPELFNNSMEFVRTYVDTAVVNLFTSIAKKNPPTADKDSLFIATEKLLKIVEESYQNARLQPFENVADQALDKIMSDILGLDSAEAIVGLPASVQKELYDTIKGTIINKISRIQQGFSKVDGHAPAVLAAKEHLNVYGMDKQNRAHASLLVNDLGHLTIQSILNFLPKFKQENYINKIMRLVENSLETISTTNNEVSKILIDFVQTPTFKPIIQSAIGNFVDNNHIAEDRAQAAMLVSNLIIEPLDQLLDKGINFEKNLGERAIDFDRNLVKNLLNVGLEYIKIKNDAKAIAKSHNRKKATYADFVEAAGDKLPKGMPLAQENYEKSIHFINQSLGNELAHLNSKQLNIFNAQLKRRLRKLSQEDKTGHIELNMDQVLLIVNRSYESATQQVLTIEQLKKLKSDEGLTLDKLILKEATQIIEELKKEIFKPDMDIILKLIFPNGASDLKFVPPEGRIITWNMIESIAPSILPLILEEAFSPDLLNQTILSVLKTVSKNLDGKISLSANINDLQNEELDELDEISGELVAELLKNMQLPHSIKKQIMGPNGVSPQIKKILGSEIRKQFNGTFIEKIIPIALESLTARDEKTGNFPLKPNAINKSASHLFKTRKQMDQKIKKASRELVNSAISNFFRQSWAIFQSKFDQVVFSLFGTIGASMKEALDKVCHFLFLTIAGKILSVALWPITRLLKEIIYRYSALDKNVNNLSDIFREVLDDQPFTQSFGLQNIALFHNTLQSTYQTFKEATN